ncbi:alpha/beta hydrolase [Paraglaciecola hydrolytica]|uniref:Serine aminopeptidase S33 domain-containing protein n=1 Tax=Paraglaciecola hydrolytica TaxID=1799789 RepID=A0A136A6X3_9ALTE|nr:alpha/beta hydrolase [Paraglaciecola hydrolytica]KXI30977.1 hypothetical protein AX660_00505 [Paraglaciecola hydrolytica]
MSYKKYRSLLLSFAFSVLISLYCSSALSEIPLVKANNLGDWVGVLSVPSGDLRLWLSIKHNEQGGLQATLESVDQAPGKKIAVKNIDIQKNVLRFDIPDIAAKYIGHWDENTKKWSGEFTQGQTFKLNFSQGKPKANSTYNELNGHWRGEIMGHPLIVRISTDELGTVAMLDSPDEGVRGLLISALAFHERSVSFEIPKAMVKFDGILALDNDQFAGTWVQQGQPIRYITFIKQSDVSVQNEPNRPQHPKGKQPYLSESVSFMSGQTKDIKIVGTLTLPAGNGPFPAAVLISGSGPQDRDETFMGHKPFAVIADYLTRHGIAVLRYDDRGVAESQGDFYAASSLDFANDANAAFNYLSSRVEIDVQSIGMIGHSEGGLIAPLASNTNEDLAFMILLAGPGIKTLDLMLAQQDAMARLQDVSEEKLQRMLRISRSIMQSVITSHTEDAAKKSVSEILSPENLNILDLPESQKSAMVNSYTSPWYRYFMSYDPAEHFTAQNLPILALYGELDVQVTAKENYTGLSDILKDHTDATIKLLPKLNHLFQQAKTGSMSEYRQIEQTFSPEVLKLISAWINARF